MLSSLRKGASNWLIKAFLGVLMASFVLWGVADVFKGYGSRAVATVAGRDIQPEQLQQAFETDFQRLQQQYGQSITREMARKFGLENQALSRLISDAVLDAHARDLKLGLNDQAILDTIKQDPTFQGANGEFNKDVFARLLRDNNLTENGFFSSQRQAQVRGQIATATQAGQSAPATAINVLHRYRNETRVLSVMPIPVDKAGPTPEPDEAALKSHHESFKSQYSAPEYRKLALLTLSPEAFKKPAEIAEDDVKAAYEQRKASFGAPEKRTLQMLSFKDMAAAEKGYKELRAGKDFLTLGKELGLKDADINLGVQAKAAMIDQVIAETAFGLKKLEISKPFQGTFSTVIVRASEIAPAVDKTYEQVKAELRDALAKEKAQAEAQAIQDKIENARSRGASLKELADKYGLKLQEIAAIDKEGHDPGGQVVPDIVGGVRVLPRAFETEVGIETEGVDLQDGFVTWLEVQSTTPSALRPFDTVKEQVKKITTTKPLMRQDNAEGIAHAGLTQAFALAKGAVGHADTGAGGRVLLRVDTITTPAAPEKAEADSLAAEISRQMTEDLANQYMAALQARYGVKVNRDAIDRASGRTATQ